jgi:K+-sensing histidine kinase KdpD
MFQLTDKTGSCSIGKHEPVSKRDSDSDSKVESRPVLTPAVDPSTKSELWRSQALRDLFVVIVAIFMATMIGVLLAVYMDEENVIGVYLLAVVVISLTCCREASLLSCALSVFCFDFFIMPPRFVLAPADPSLLLSFAVMFVVGAAISHLTGQIKDLAENLEQRVQGRTDELQKVNDNLRREVQQRLRAEGSQEALIKELSASNAVLSSMVRIASHDLQEPLRVIQGYCDLLKRRYSEKLDVDGTEFLDFIVEGTHRMESLIQGVLTHARVKQGIERFQRTELDGVVTEALSNIAVSIDQSGATVVADDLPIVVGDRTQLVQLFQNLILNAVRFRSSEPLVVRISCDRQGDHYLLSVADNGIGIAPAYHEEVFGMFRRLSSQMVPSGSGIGLAICKSVVENHGGRIWVESESGKGSRFVIALPVSS